MQNNREKEMRKVLYRKLSINKKRTKLVGVGA